MFKVWGSGVRDLCLSYEDVASLLALPEPLLRSLLELYRSPLTAAGLDLDAIGDTTSLWTHRARLPAELVDAIHCIQEFANNDGVEEIVRAAGGPLFVGPIDQVPLVFAARTLIEHPNLFARIVGRQVNEPMCRFREFVGRDRAVARAELDLQRAAGMVGGAFGRRGHGEECRIHAWTEKDGSDYFSIERAGIPRIERALVDGKLCMVKCLPMEHDLVVYDGRLGRLRVSAPDASMTGLYARLFGELLFGAGDWFHSSVVVSLEPIREMGQRALYPNPGVDEARVIRLELASRASGGGLVMTRAADVLRLLSELLVDPGQYGPLRAVTLRLKVRRERKMRLVHLEVPDVLSWDWRRGNTVIRGFLEERGLVRGVEGGAAWQVA